MKIKQTSGSAYIDQRPWLWWTCFILNGVIGFGFWAFVLVVAICFYGMLFAIMAGLPKFL